MCPEPELECDFEDETLCLWVNDDTDDVNWGRTKGEDAGAYRPSIDHTTQSEEGSYIHNMAYNLLGMGPGMY